MALKSHTGNGAASELVHTAKGWDEAKPAKRGDALAESRADDAGDERRREEHAARHENSDQRRSPGQSDGETYNACGSLRALAEVTRERRRIQSGDRYGCDIHNPVGHGIDAVGHIHAVVAQHGLVDIVVGGLRGTRERKIQAFTQVRKQKPRHEAGAPVTRNDDGRSRQSRQRGNYERG